MVKIGRKIYYDLATGNVLVNTGEMSGHVIGTTSEQDFTLYAALQDKNPEAIGILQFEYGELSDEFRLCTGYSVNIATGEMVFDYTPEAAEELEEIKTTAQRIAELETKDALREQQLAEANENITVLYEMILFPV